VMTLLVSNVGNDPVKMRAAEAEYAVARLPIEALLGTELVVSEMGRDALHLLCESGA